MQAQICPSEGGSTDRVLFTADAYSQGGRQFIVLPDEGLGAFSELSDLQYPPRRQK